MLELLAPAGNLQIYKSVVNAGADAVYFGGEAFGARAYAGNFSREEAAEAMAYGRRHGVKSYLTVNTLLKNVEFERKLYDYLRFYYEQGVDALIVQDLGLIPFVQAYFSGLELHASTQMTITSAPGAALVKQLGCSRVVTSRELSLHEIAAIHEAVDIEIEAFVHGALCVCYSGGCLMSSMLGGRSGNRGRCAQPCRLPYKLLDEDGRALRTKGEYLLSPKDFCAIDYIGELADAGVSSLKIEGRMKQLSYATGVVSIYRRYVDAYLQGRSDAVAQADRQLLFDLGNRSGFTSSYLTQHNDSSMLAYKKPGHEKGLEFPEAEERKTSLSGHFYAKAGQELKFEVVVKGSLAATAYGPIPELATKSATTSETIREKLSKCGGTSFVFEELQIETDDNLFIPIGQINALRREALDKLLTQLEENPYASVRESKDWDKGKALCTPNSPTSTPATHAPHLLITCKSHAQFKAACDFLASRSNSSFQPQAIISLNLEAVLPPANALSTLTTFAHSAGCEFYLTLPCVLRASTLAILDAHPEFFDTDLVDGLIARSIDTLGDLSAKSYPTSRIHLDSRIYAYSDATMSYLRSLGYSGHTLPLELNSKELAHRDNHDGYLSVYGRSLLMVTTACQQKNTAGCTKEESTLFLQDRKNLAFPVKNVCSFCYNEIYNSVVTSLLTDLPAVERLGVAGLRLDFTIEEPKEVARVLNQLLQNSEKAGPEITSHPAPKPNAHQDHTKPNTKRQNNPAPANYTKGHFNRGVE